MATSGFLPEGRYTIGELLELRNSLPVITCPIGKVNKHVEIASIFRLPDEAINDPQRFSCHSQTLANITNRRNFSQCSRKNFTESSEESEDRMTASMNSKHESRQYQWNFRRRESSDRSSQPHSAPTGIAAQQSENFQRFYRAVVSPTHLRVTAGGRIVPNTRSTAGVLPPPQLDWNIDKIHFDHKGSISKPADITCLAPQAPAGYPTSTMNAFMPPYSFVPQGSAFPEMMLLPQPSIEGNSNMTCGELMLATITGDGIGSSTFSPGAPTQPIKISPPSQFDQSKPYMINGQIVYPVPQTFHPPPAPLPAGPAILGSPGFMPQPQFPSGGGYLPAQFPGLIPGTPGIPGPFLFPGHHIPMMMPNLLPADVMGPMFPYLPIRGIPAQPEAMRAQIHHFHNQIKFLDHQLANNRHQIDEHATEAQRAIFIGQIRNLELMLEYQAAQGAGAARGQQNVDEAHLNKWMANVPPVAYSTKPDSEGTAAKLPSVSLQKKYEENGTIYQSAELPQDPVVTNTPSRVEPIVKSKLSIKAPAFQPRSQVSSQALVILPQNHQARVTDGTDDLALEMMNEKPETQEQIEDRLTSRATGKYGNRSSSIITISPSNLQRAHTQHEPATRNEINSQPPTPRRSSTFNCSEGGISSIAVPYLIGSLPHGIHSSLAKSTDFSYSRPLTDEEVRARHLYWGKAPHSVQRGLPKFDGKDFYPPSPVKKNVKMSTTNNSVSSACDRDDLDYVATGFETLFTKPNVPGYKTPSPVRPLHAGQINSSMPQSAYLIGPNSQVMRQSQQPSFAGAGSTMTGRPGNYGLVRNGSRLPSTPPSGIKTKEVALDDFSNLFNEPGVPGYQSPSTITTKPAQKLISPKKIDTEMPAMPNDPEFSLKTNGETVNAAVSSLWQQNDGDHLHIYNESDTVISSFSTKDGVHSSRSSIEFHLSPQKILSPRSAHEKAFVERVENFRNSEVQTLFLQNMLKNVSQSGPVLSGAITPTTAQGFLPQYRGSAAASLTPAMMSCAVADRGFQYCQTHLETINDSGQATVAVVSADILAENRPPHVTRRNPPVSGANDDSGAQGYMRYLTEKDDKNKKKFEQALSTEISLALPSQRPAW